MFQDPKLRRQLNEATHLPIIVQILRELYWHRLVRPWRLVVLDAPLLLETRLDMLCHTVLVVACQEQQQVQRVMARDGVDQAQASNALKAQMSLEDKKQRATIVFDNSGSLEQLQAQVARWTARSQQLF